MGANTGVADIDTGLILRMSTENTPHFGRDNVPGILDMVGQVINSSLVTNRIFVYGGTRIFT